VRRHNIKTYSSLVNYLNQGKDFVDRVGVRGLKFFDKFIEIDIISYTEDGVVLTKDEQRLFKNAYYNKNLKYVVENFESILLGNEYFIEVKKPSDVDIATEILTNRMY
jgi:hypothetical protein